MTHSKYGDLMQGREGYEPVTQIDLLHRRSADLKSLEANSRPRLKDITVVIPTIGRPLLEQCLYWLGVGSNWPENLLIVAQGLHSDIERWISLLQSKGMDGKCICSTGRGRSQALNEGLKTVSTRFLAITDDDCFVDAKWLVTL